MDEDLGMKGWLRIWEDRMVEDLGSTCFLRIWGGQNGWGLEKDMLFQGLWRIE